MTPIVKDLEGKELVANWASHAQVGFEKFINKLLVDRYVEMRESGAPSTAMPETLKVPGPVIRILRDAAAAKAEMVFKTDEPYWAKDLGRRVGKFYSDMGLLDIEFDLDTFAAYHPELAGNSVMLLTNSKTGETIFEIRNFWVREAE